MTPEKMIRPIRRIAVVDDDSAVRKSLMRLLETASYDVRTFGNAGEFIDALAHAVPECALIDLQMPNMTGLQLQQYLAGAEIIIPIIIITAHEESGSKERCMALGATAYMVKPLRRAELLAAIDSAMTTSM